MSTFDSQLRSSSAHAPESKSTSPLAARAPAVNLHGFPEQRGFAPRAPSSTGRQAFSEVPEAAPATAPRLPFDFGRVRVTAPALQRKPLLGSPGDAYEHEADAVADQVLRMGTPGPMTPAPAVLQRKCAACANEDKKKLQARHVPTADASAELDTDSALRATERSGAPLSPEVRTYFEPRFGYDFSRVRVHVDGEGARAVQARAYTVGHDIVFGRGEYAPGTVEGRRLIAHELTHVVQQAGPGATPSRAHPGAQPASPVEPGPAGVHAPAIQQKVTPPALQREAADAATGTGGPPSTTLTARDASECTPLYLQKLCVRELGGCIESRDAGVPAPEELATYNASCRAESGYTGPDVELSEEECSALRSPTCKRGDAESAREAAREARVSKALALSVKYMPGGASEELARLVTDPVFIASLGVAVGVYLALWLAPEPLFTKITAAATTLAILGTGYFSVSTLLNLARAWGDLENEASAAQSDAELERVAEKFGKRMGAVEADLLLFLASLLVGGRLPGPKRLPAPSQALGQAERALATAGEGVVSSGPGFNAKVIRFRPRAAPTSGAPRASVSFEGNLALNIELPGPAQVAEVIPFPRPQPAPAPVEALTSPAAAASPVAPPVVPVASPAGTSAPRARPPFILYLPREKSPHLPEYRRMLGVLQSDPYYQRPKTNQIGDWDKALQPGGSYGMSQSTYQRGLNLGLTHDQIVIPDWSRTRSTPFEVDHVIELQVVPPTMVPGWFDTIHNYELLDGGANRRAGPRLRSAIQRERAKQVAFNPAPATQVLKFDDVQMGDGSNGERWTVDDIQSGVHLDVKEMEP